MPWTRRTHLAFSAALALSCVLFAGPARAQSASEVGAARQLFERGLVATRDRRWQDAEQAFSQSYAIAPRVSTLLNLGGALEQLGRLVEASEAFRRVLADRSAQARRLHESAEAALERVTPRIGRVRWEVEGGLLAGDRVLLDGVELAEATRGVDVPVDPGAHVLRLERGGAVRERHVDVGEGQQRVVLLVAPPLAPTTVDPPPAADTVVSTATADVSEAPERATRVRRRRWIGVAVGLVVVGAALGIGFGVADSDGDAHRGNLGDGRIRF